MKKIVLTSFCVAAMTCAAFAQGKLTWVSINPGNMTAQTNTSVSSLFGGTQTGGVQGVTSLTSGAYLYALLYNSDSVPVSGPGVVKPATLAALGGWTASLTAANSTSSAGRLVTTGTTGTSVTVPWAAGVTNNIMMVGWSANLGSTFAAALATMNSPVLLGAVVGNAFFGMSNTGYIAAGAGDPGSGAFGAAATAQGLPINSALTQLYLVPVPEPGTIALAGLGGLALLALRRRK